MKINKVFELRIDSAGNISKHNVYTQISRGFNQATEEVTYGFSVTISEELPYWQRELRETALLMDNGQLYISQEIWSALDGGYQFWYDIKLGRRGYKLFDAEFVTEAIDHNSYPRRNDREREVQKRNNNLIEFLMAQVG